MPEGSVQLVVYGLVAALSPLGLAATLAVLAGGRVRALAFGLGFVAAQLAACAALLAIGDAVAPQRGNGHATFRALLELAFGAALLWLAVRVRARPDALGRGATGRAAGLLDRLRRLRPVTALAAGALLGVGGPKRLVLTALAAASIAASGADEARLVVGYTTLATLLVWAPILTFVLFGERGRGWLRAAETGLGRHRSGTAFWSLLAVGALAAADALASLL